MFTSIDKAIAAIIGGLLTVAAQFGLDVSWATDGLIGSVGAIITALLVYIVPNKEGETEEPVSEETAE